MSHHACVRLLLCASVLALSAGAPAVETAVREFYIVTVHIDGKTNVKGDSTHKPEAFPEAPFASTKGMWVKEPQADGEWSVRTFVFDPAEVTVQQGDEVRLHFVGVQGAGRTRLPSKASRSRSL
jgi:hypothetical protein